MTQRINFRLRNNSARPFMMSITDRPTEITTTSMNAAGDSLPAMSELSTYLGDDDILVISETSISIEKRKEEDNE